MLLCLPCATHSFQTIRESLCTFHPPLSFYFFISSAFHGASDLNVQTGLRIPGIKKDLVFTINTYKRCLNLIISICFVSSNNLCSGRLSEMAAFIFRNWFTKFGGGECNIHESDTGVNDTLLPPSLWSLHNPDSIWDGEKRTNMGLSFIS